MCEQYEAPPQRKSQDVRRGSRGSFLRCCFCAFVANGSSANHRKIVRKSTKIQPRPTRNRRKIVLEPLWAPKAVSGTRPDVLGTFCERPNAAPKPILGRRGRAKNGQEMSKKLPRVACKCSKTLRLGRPSACRALNGFTHVFRSIFGRFRLVARKLRCASRTSFYSVLLSSHEVHTERA